MGVKIISPSNATSPNRTLLTRGPDPVTGRPKLGDVTEVVAGAVVEDGVVKEATVVVAAEV